MFTPPGATQRQPTQDEAKRAAGILDVHMVGLRLESVRSAYRAKIREAHPDAGGDTDIAADRLRQLRAARDTLLAWLDRQPDPECKECSGRGYTAGRWGAKPCSRCG